jgi:M61 glycyl aminopeptidase
MQLVSEKVEAPRLVNKRSTRSVEGTDKRRAFVSARDCRRLCAVFLFLLCVGASASARSPDVKITIVSASPARVRVEGRREAGTTAWSFRDSYAGAVGLAGRIENLSLSDESGAAVPVRQLAPGEFTSAKAATRFSYEMRLDPPAFVSDASHISWLAADRGLLMPGDILPLPFAGARDELVLATGWSVSTVESKNADGTFDVADAERSVFVVGHNLREHHSRAGRLALTLATVGDWAFTDAEAADSAEEILKIYEEVTGGVPSTRAMLAVLPPPQSVAGNVWNAETRGSTVVLLSGNLSSKLAALAQLNGAITHELFHLWVPNGLALEGEYDWFYEGFTNYQALRVAMRRGQLTFQNYLDALGREFDAYRSAREGKEVSLAEASQRRWSGGTALVYHKGMLVAFLYDLALMRETGGKSSLDAAYRELFRRYGQGGARADGNRAVVEILSGMPGMRDFVERYVVGASEIDLASRIETFGLRIEPGGARTHVGVAASPDRSQRELLRKLGYNEGADAESRKLHEQLKKRLPR